MIETLGGIGWGWVTLAVVFAAVWIYALWRQDVRNPEPVWMVLLATGGGVLAFLAADRVEEWLLPDLAFLDGTLIERAHAAFTISGPVEEGLKFLAVVTLVWPWTRFSAPLDGVVYGTAAAAGFALAENLAFMEGDPHVIFARGPVGTTTHVLFAALWGGALGHSAHLRGWWRKAGVVLLGLLVAAAAHGAFNMITFSVERELTLWQGRGSQIILLLGCLLFLRWRVRLAHAEAPFRYRGKGV